MNNPRNHCAECGTEFDAASLVFSGRVYATQRYCSACVLQREEAQALERQRLDSERLTKAWERICPPLFRDTDPNMLPCSHSVQQSVLSWQYGPRGLLIGGPPRTGKTRLVFQLLARLHFVERRRIIALTATDFSHQISRRFTEGAGKGEQLVDDLASVSVLFIDDLGKGRLTDRVEAEFYHVIDTRITHLRPTILTTNLNGDAFAALWSPDRSEPLLKRFQEFFQTVTVLAQETEATT